MHGSAATILEHYQVQPTVRWPINHSLVWGLFAGRYGALSSKSCLYSAVPLARQHVGTPIYQISIKCGSWGPLTEEPRPSRSLSPSQLQPEGGGNEKVFYLTPHLPLSGGSLALTAEGVCWHPGQVLGPFGPGLQTASMFAMATHFAPPGLL